MTTTTEMRPPDGATHLAEFYGRLVYYQRRIDPHYNQVSDEWQDITVWKSWDSGKKAWVAEGSGFCKRNVYQLTPNKSAPVSGSGVLALNG